MWQHALYLDGQVYFPKDLDFCQRVAAASGAIAMDQRAELSWTPITGPLSHNYVLVSSKCQTKINESLASNRSFFSTERVFPSLAELQRELKLTILREKYRRFMEDIRSDHKQREEYDPVKPYYEKSQIHMIEGEEYDPERPRYHNND